MGLYHYARKSGVAKGVLRSGALGVLLCLGAFGAESVVSVSARPVPPQESLKTTHPPFFPHIPAALSLTLPLDQKPLKSDVRSGGAKGSMKIGDFVPVPAEYRKLKQWADKSAWELVPDGGRVLSLAFHSPEAVGVRVGISGLQLPPGAYLVSYSALPGQPVYGPHHEEDLAHGELWLPTAFGDTALVQVYVPPEASVESVALEISRICHIHSLPHTAGPTPKAASDCNVDAACHPAWDSVGDAVAGLSLITYQGAIFCTGTLLAAPEACLERFYLLTANHCVGAQWGTQGADSLEFYWNYAAPSCGATPPHLSEVPRTVGGAELLAGQGGDGATGGGTDFSLLELRQAPPPSAMQAGWSTATPPIGAQVVALHHPRGDYRRFSSGRIVNLLNPFPDLFHMVIWSSGTTEIASSGAPLFRADTQQVIGQLWGGAASCFFPIGPDFFGRLDNSYHAFSDLFDSGGAMTLTLEDSVIPVEAGMHAVALSLARPAPPGGFSIGYEWRSGTALAGVDFAAAIGTVEVAGGDRTLLIPIHVLATSMPYDERSVLLDLSLPPCIGLAEESEVIEMYIAEDKTDTDGEGLRDIDELTAKFGYFTDPALPDTDSDGMSDYEEIFGVHGFHTSPIEADSDGDQIDDFFEILVGLDPLVDEGVPLSTFRVEVFRDSTDALR